MEVSIMAAKDDKPTIRTMAENRKARFNYIIEDTIEAGLILEGSEVKALRAGTVNIGDAYAAAKHGDELWLLNCHIDSPRRDSAWHGHEPMRPRKLLLRKREINKLLGMIKLKGMTLVPLSLYFNARGFAKVRLGIASGKKQHEKRDAIKKRDWERQKSRIMKG